MVAIGALFLLLLTACSSEHYLVGDSYVGLMEPYWEFHTGCPTHDLSKKGRLAARVLLEDVDEIASQVALLDERVTPIVFLSAGAVDEIQWPRYHALGGCCRQGNESEDGIRSPEPARRHDMTIARRVRWFLESRNVEYELLPHGHSSTSLESEIGPSSCVSDPRPSRDAISNPSGVPRRGDFNVRGCHGPLSSAEKGVTGIRCLAHAQSRAQGSRPGCVGVGGGPWARSRLM